MFAKGKGTTIAQRAIAFLSPATNVIVTFPLAFRPGKSTRIPLVHNLIRPVL